MKKKKKKTMDLERLREIAWDVGHNYPVPLTADYIALSMINPHRGHIHWNVGKKSLTDLRKKKGIKGESLVVRVYDVTDILFDGSAAHRSFDLETGGRSGGHYFSIDRQGRNYLAEVGIRDGDGSFHPLARSCTAYFDGDRPAGNYRTEGLFAGGLLNRTFTVENIFDAPFYEKMNREMAGIERDEKLSVAVVLLALGQEGSLHDSLRGHVKNVSRQFSKFGGRAALFTQDRKDVIDGENKNVPGRIRTVSKKVIEKVREAHRRSPFHLVHCHDWYSAKTGIDAAKELEIPLVFSLHSTEDERAEDSERDALSRSIRSWEKKGAQEAALVIVPHSSTRQQVIDLYGADPEKVVIIPDMVHKETSDTSRKFSSVRQSFGFPPDVPVVLFAGEMSHASGADLLVEALPAVCRNHGTAHFVFVGEGPLRGELESRASQLGIGDRCRFTGHISGKAFESILMASDFVVIPARTWQDEGLARMTIDYGRPVLTTHQSGIQCVVHGETGLVTFDNPGSITWGVQELLFNPMKESMHRIAVTKSAREGLSLETIAARHYLYYEILLNSDEGTNCA